MSVTRRAYLHARLAQIHAQAVRVFAIVLHEVLQIPERGSPGDEEAALVQLTNTVVLHRIAVAHYGQSSTTYIPLWRFNGPSNFAYGDRTPTPRAITPDHYSFIYYRTIGITTG